MPTEQQLLDVKKQIEELLEKNGAVLVPVTLISGDRVFSRVDIVPVDSAKVSKNKE